jgi:hypothetical protein
MIDDRTMHRPLNSIGDVGWSRNLKEMPAGMYQKEPTQNSISIASITRHHL